MLLNSTYNSYIPLFHDFRAFPYTYIDLANVPHQNFNLKNLYFPFICHGITEAT